MASPPWNGSTTQARYCGCRRALVKAAITLLLLFGLARPGAGRAAVAQPERAARVGVSMREFLRAHSRVPVEQFRRAGCPAPTEAERDLGSVIWRWRRRAPPSILAWVDAPLFRRPRRIA